MKLVMTTSIHIVRVPHGFIRYQPMSNFFFNYTTCYQMAIEDTNCYQMVINYTN